MIDWVGEFENKVFYFFVFFLCGMVSKCCSDAQGMHTLLHHLELSKDLSFGDLSFGDLSLKNVALRSLHLKESPHQNWVDVLIQSLLPRRWFCQHLLWLCLPFDAVVLQWAKEVTMGLQ